MAARIVDIADAVVTALNGASFSQSFTAVRRFCPTYKLEDMDVLHVTVVPAGMDADIHTRVDNRNGYQVDVAVQKSTEEAGIEANAAAMTLLLEEIRDYFLRDQIEDATCMEASADPLYDAAHLRDMSQFTGVVTLTFWETQEVADV